MSVFKVEYFVLYKLTTQATLIKNQKHFVRISGLPKESFPSLKQSEGRVKSLFNNNDKQMFKAQLKNGILFVGDFAAVGVWVDNS